MSKTVFPTQTSKMMKRLGIFLILFCVAAFDAQSQERKIEVQPSGKYAEIDTRVIRSSIATFKGTDNAAKEELVQTITKNPGNYPPPVLMILAAYYCYEKNEPEKAYFWFCFGRLRGRYDAARCADTSAREAIGVLIQDVDPESQIRRYISRIPADALVPFAKQILQLDNSTPYHYDQRWINLHGMGAFDGPAKQLSLPESQWPALHEKICREYYEGAQETATKLKETPAQK